MADIHDSQIEWTTHHYDGDGNHGSATSHSASDLDSSAVSTFAARMAFLSGTLQLPLKTDLDDERSHLSYEIFNESTAAYILYYVFDDVVATTLILPGISSEDERQVMSVFRYQLLEESDEPEPTEEYIEQLLSSPDYDFESQWESGETEPGPTSFSITFAPPPGHEDDMPKVAKINRELTAAFVALASCRR